jgi:hypothetical protein
MQLGHGRQPGVWLSLARALGSGPRGRRFKSCHPDLHFLRIHSFHPQELIRCLRSLLKRAAIRDRTVNRRSGIFLIGGGALPVRWRRLSPCSQFASSFVPGWKRRIICRLMALNSRVQPRQINCLFTVVQGSQASTADWSGHCRPLDSAVEP